MTPGPARASERIFALDVLRGFALLGILTMNITLGLPGVARLIPTIAGGFEGLNFAVWLAGFLLFDEKMFGSSNCSPVPSGSAAFDTAQPSGCGDRSLTGKRSQCHDGRHEISARGHPCPAIDRLQPAPEY